MSIINNNILQYKAEMTHYIRGANSKQRPQVCGESSRVPKAGRRGWTRREGVDALTRLHTASLRLTALFNSQSSWMVWTLPLEAEDGTESDGTQSHFVLRDSFSTNKNNI